MNLLDASTLICTCIPQRVTNLEKGGGGVNGVSKNIHSATKSIVSCDQLKSE